jgi:hypothetical protein
MRFLVAALQTHLDTRWCLAASPLLLLPLLRTAVYVLLLPHCCCFLSLLLLLHSQEMKRFQSREAGYQRIQGTKPQTLAYALQVIC